eukprot:scaffold1323_cov160-Amphora_coffeaeformis.AAC.24
MRLGFVAIQKLNGRIPKRDSLGANNLAGDPFVVPNRGRFAILDGATAQADKADIVSRAKADSHDRSSMSVVFSIVMVERYKVQHNTSSRKHDAKVMVATTRCTPAFGWICLGLDDESSSHPQPTNAGSVKTQPPTFGHVINDCHYFRKRDDDCQQQQDPPGIERHAAVTQAPSL